MLVMRAIRETIPKMRAPKNLLGQQICSRARCSNVNPFSSVPVWFKVTITKQREDGAQFKKER
jgi:hypothetical protein